MPREWTAQVVARMHLARITARRLAAEAGYTPEYVSMVLNGHRDTGPARDAILAALERLTGEREEGTDSIIVQKASHKTDFREEEQHAAEH